MLEVPAMIEPIFRAAGWQGPKKQTLLDKTSASAIAIARAIVDEFGGLTVGTCGPGSEMATSDVRFYEHLRPEGSELFQEWGQQTGAVVAFASAHHDHMVLLVGAEGRFYVFTDPDDQLYAFPHDFGEMMGCLLWGYPFGPTIPKDLRREEL